MKYFLLMTTLSLSCIGCTSGNEYQDALVGTWMCKSSIGSIVETRTYSTYEADGGLTVYAISEGIVSDESLAIERDITLGDKAIFRSDYQGQWSIDGALVTEHFRGEVKLKSLNDIAKKLEDRSIQELTQAFSDDTVASFQFQILRADDTQMKIRRIVGGKIDVCTKTN